MSGICFMAVLGILRSLKLQSYYVLLYEFIEHVETSSYQSFKTFFGVHISMKIVVRNNHQIFTAECNISLLNLWRWL